MMRNRISQAIFLGIILTLFTCLSIGISAQTGGQSITLRTPIDIPLGGVAHHVSEPTFTVRTSADPLSSPSLETPFGREPLFTSFATPFVPYIKWFPPSEPVTLGLVYTLDRGGVPDRRTSWPLTFDKVFLPRLGEPFTMSVNQYARIPPPINPYEFQPQTLELRSVTPYISFFVDAPLFLGYRSMTTPAVETYLLQDEYQGSALVPPTTSGFTLSVHSIDTNAQSVTITLKAVDDLPLSTPFVITDRGRYTRKGKLPFSIDMDYYDGRNLEFLFITPSGSERISLQKESPKTSHGFTITLQNVRILDQLGRIRDQSSDLPFSDDTVLVTLTIEPVIPPEPVETPRKLGCQIRSGRYMPYAIASCQPGEVATGGGCNTESPTAPILASCPSNGGPGCNPSGNPAAWFCSVSNSYVTSYAVCCK